MKVSLTGVSLHVRNIEASKAFYLKVPDTFRDGIFSLAEQIGMALTIRYSIIDACQAYVWRREQPVQLRLLIVQDEPECFVPHQASPGSPAPCPEP